MVLKRGKLITQLARSASSDLGEYPVQTHWFDRRTIGASSLWCLDSPCYLTSHFSYYSDTRLPSIEGWWWSNIHSASFTPSSYHLPFVNLSSSLFLSLPLSLFLFLFLSLFLRHPLFLSLSLSSSLSLSLFSPLSSPLCLCFSFTRCEHLFIYMIHSL